MKIFNHHSLKKYHTFALECEAKQIAVVEHDEEIQTLLNDGFFNKKYYIVGAGSNLIFPPFFDGAIVRLNTKGVQVLHSDDYHVYVEVQAGEIFDEFIQYCVEKSWYGIENLAYIPGQVGSAAVQNVGAYGIEAKDVIYQVNGFMLPSGEKRTLQNNECHFGYRNSIFKNELKGQFLITSLVFKLSLQEKFHLEYKAIQDFLLKNEVEISLKNVYHAIVQIRKSKLPEVDQVPSAGSFFKNPVVKETHFQKLLKQFPNLVSYPLKDGFVKLAAGQLIELCGWKENPDPNVGVYEKQALVIVNNGGATPQEVIDFSAKIKKSVQETMEVSLEEEVIFVGTTTIFPRKNG